jgi:Icc-related predicted phosphoesterase
MKIQLISDLHLNAVNRIYLNLDADIYVIAGDLAVDPKIAAKYIEKIKKAKDIPIIYVLGNHEYYGHDISSAHEYKSALEKLDQVYLLDNESVTIDSIEFLGTTLWSNLDDPMAAYMVSQYFNDYECIRDGARPITPQATHSLHIRNIKWLTSKLDGNSRKVVISHHAPSFECRARDFDYRTNSQYTTKGFCSNLETLIYQTQPLCWMYGHTHRSRCLKIGNTRVISKQIGYEHERKLVQFDSNLIEL